MWAFALWIALLTVAGLVYPRRPVLSGVLFLCLGLLSVVLYLTHTVGGNGLGALAGIFWMGLGVWYIVKYSNRDARKKHVDYWTEKA